MAVGAYGMVRVYFFYLFIFYFLFRPTSISEARTVSLYLLCACMRTCVCVCVLICNVCICMCVCVRKSGLCSLGSFCIWLMVSPALGCASEENPFNLIVYFIYSFSFTILLLLQSVT